MSYYGVGVQNASTRPRQYRARWCFHLAELDF